MYVHCTVYTSLKKPAIRDPLFYSEGLIFPDNLIAFNYHLTYLQQRAKSFKYLQLPFWK